jgi:hypothetical protein
MEGLRISYLLHTWLGKVLFISRSVQARKVNTMEVRCMEEARFGGGLLIAREGVVRD